ncbi:methyltransferase domain-containing protein [bacterium]|nr:methyltransferase domain-containing protein [bacterium]
MGGEGNESHKAKIRQTRVAHHSSHEPTRYVERRRVSTNHADCQPGLPNRRDFIHGGAYPKRKPVGSSASSLEIDFPMNESSLKTKHEWCFRFFNNPDYLTIYKDMTGPARTETEVEFCQAVFKWKRGDPILDAPCGAGRHALQIAKQGFTVTGLDFSNYLLGRAVYRSNRLPLHYPYPYFIRGLMQTMPFLDNHFQYIICMFSSFGYGETQEENLAVMKEFHRVLKPGGKALIDLMNRHFIIPRLNKVYTSVQHGLKVREERSITDNQHRLHNVISVEDREGNRRTYLYNPWLYNGWELAYLANQAGLEVDAIYGNFDREEYTLESQRAMLVARKPI